VFVVLERGGQTQLLTSVASDGTFDQAIVPASQLLPHFPSATVDALTLAQIRQGKDFRLSPFIDRAGAKHVKAVSQEGYLIAIGEARLPHLYHPILVIGVHPRRISWLC